ncbi:MAG: galactokinase family protein, partial [Dysgonomonas sp.]
MDLTQLKEKFKSLYGEGGSLYTSPGRINLIGEHTDYNG